MIASSTHERIERIASTTRVVQHMIADASIPSYYAMAHNGTEDRAIVHCDSIMVARILCAFVAEYAPSWYAVQRPGDYSTVIVARRVPLALLD